MDLAQYKCLKCSHTWKGRTGPTNCPACKHEYVKWVNYEEMRKEWDKHERDTKV